MISTPRSIEEMMLDDSGAGLALGSKSVSFSSDFHISTSERCFPIVITKSTSNENSQGYANQTADSVRSDLNSRNSSVYRCLDSSRVSMPSAVDNQCSVRSSLEEKSSSYPGIRIQDLETMNYNLDTKIAILESTNSAEYNRNHVIIPPINYFPRKWIYSILSFYNIVALLNFLILALCFLFALCFVIREKDYSTIHLAAAVVLFVSFILNVATTTFWKWLLQDIHELLLNGFDATLSFPKFVHPVANLELNLLLAKIQEYKAYMPSCNVDTTRNFTLNPNNSSKASAVETTRSGGLSLPSQRSSVHIKHGEVSSRISSRKPSGNDSLLTPCISLGGIVFMPSLITRKCAFCLVDCHRFHRLLKLIPINDVLRFHSMFVDDLTHVFSTTKAMIDRFVGDKMLASWNTTPSFQASYTQLACTAALQCEKALGDKKYTQIQSNVRFRICVVTGEAWCGVLGTIQSRAFSLVGPLVNWCHTLNKISCQLPGGIIVDKEVYNTVRMQFRMHAMDYVNSPSIGISTVYRLVGQIEMQALAGDDVSSEWMYEMRNNNQYSMYDDFNCGITHIFEGSIRKGFQLLLPYLQASDVDPLIIATVQRMLTRISSNLSLTSLIENNSLALLPLTSSELLPLR